MTTPPMPTHSYKPLHEQIHLIAMGLLECQGKPNATHGTPANLLTVLELVHVHVKQTEEQLAKLLNDFFGPDDGVLIYAGGRGCHELIEMVVNRTRCAISSGIVNSHTWVALAAPLDIVATRIERITKTMKILQDAITMQKQEGGFY